MCLFQYRTFQRLNNHGFTYVRERQNILQKWYNDISTCHYLPMLEHYKINFDYEMYIDILRSKLRNILS